MLRKTHSRVQPLGAELVSYDASGGVVTVTLANRTPARVVEVYQGRWSTLPARKVEGIGMETVFAFEGALFASIPMVDIERAFKGPSQ